MANDLAQMKMQRCSPDVAKRYPEEILLPALARKAFGPRLSSRAGMNQIVDAIVRTDQSAQWNFQISEVVIVCTFFDSWLEAVVGTPLTEN
jgi:hypothetical protein